MSITMKSFGKGPGGREATLYTCANAAGASISVTDFGARLVSVVVPDRNGKLSDVCVGFDDVAPYAAESSYVGATIGRVGNRISRGEFFLNGTAYALYKNEGQNTLHGGKEGFDRRWWEAGVSSDADERRGTSNCTVSFTRTSPDGEENFPGSLDVSVQYVWTDDNELTIRYHAVSDRDTLCNLTNHAYYNLAGSGDILDHEILIHAHTVTETDEALIPTGRDIPVEGLPVDLRALRSVRGGIVQSEAYPMMVKVKGYDFNYPVNGSGMREHAVLCCRETGRVMRVRSTEPCIQLYTGQGFHTIGRGGIYYGPYAGLALETQHHPDAVHHAAFPSVVLKAGEAYDSVTVYRFETEQN